MRKQKTVKDLPIDKNYAFVADSQDVEEIKKAFPRSRNAKKSDSFFVEIENGDYSSVYGIEGIIPYLEKLLYKVK